MISTRSVNTYDFVVSGPTLVVLEARGDWSIGFTKKGNAIVRIDPDGDIFIRGKWVAWSGSLRDQMKTYYDNEEKYWQRIK